MKLIIDIPEDVYTRLFDNGIQDNEIEVDDVCEMARALRLGTPIKREPCVSRVEVYEIMGNLMSIPYDFDRNITEQDVFESMGRIRELPMVQPKADLDKIKAEIEELRFGQPLRKCVVDECLEIIDKYRQEG